MGNVCPLPTLKWPWLYLRGNIACMTPITRSAGHTAPAGRLSQSIGSCVRFNGPHNTGESRQFVHTTLEKLSHFTKGMCEPSHFTKGMCEPSHFTKGMCGPSHFTKGKCRPQINLMILIVWATVENPWGSVERTVPSGEFLGCLHCAAGQCEGSLGIFLGSPHTAP